MVTRGDALLDPDPPVRAGDVLGRVESIERGGSRVAREVSWGRRGRRGGAGAVGAAGADEERRRILGVRGQNV